MELINPMVKAFRRAAQDDPDGFWARAAESLPWHRRWDRVFEWDPDTLRREPARDCAP